ncbi:unnamed protein product [Auanema sp. JU1783]|nr:unnamed protein product [Auanema sp. JU1783]
MDYGGAVNVDNEKAFALNDSLNYFQGADAPFKFSTDVPHQSSHPFLNLDGYSSFLQSNPLHRRVEYAGKMNHQRFEAWDSSYIPYEDVEGNIKIEVSWEKFGCCSACCCSHELCGLYASMKNCKSVFSKKIRKGYLSIKKLDPKRKVSPENLNNFFSVSPYMDAGIPLYSTVLDSLMIHTKIESWKSSFNKINKITSYKGMGVYIEEKSCANDRQKLDCFELAKCKKVLLKTEEDEKTKLQGAENDPCAEINITSIIIKEGQSLYRVREGENYRIQLDSLIFNTDQGVKWKISLDFVPNYRSKQDCSEQDRSVHPNGKDLLLIGLSRRDMNKRIEASTLDGMKVRFELKNVIDNTADGWKTFTVVIWAALIIIFFSFIMMFVIVIEGTKTKRIRRILHNKAEEAK